MLSGAAHARESHWEVAMARRYVRDKNGRFASTGSSSLKPYKGSDRSMVASARRHDTQVKMTTERRTRIVRRVTRTADRQVDAASARVSKAHQAFKSNPTSANQKAWIKAGKEFTAAATGRNRLQTRAYRALDRKIPLPKGQRSTGRR